MFKKNFAMVWLGIIVLSGMFLMGQEGWAPGPEPNNLTLDNLLITDDDEVAARLFYSRYTRMDLSELAEYDEITVTDSLAIDSTSQASLAGLQNLKGVLQSLTVQNNDALIDLTGLEGLTSVWGDLRVEDNYLLTTLEGLNNLLTADTIYIQGNDSLASLSGLGSLNSVTGELYIGHNWDLTSLNGLNNLVSVGMYMVITSNYELASFDGLNSLASVSYMSIYGNYNLLNLNGLESLTTVNDSLGVWGNDSLTNLAGIDNITSIIDRLDIFDNPSLPTCEAERLAYDAIGDENIGGVIGISGNCDTCTCS